MNYLPCNCNPISVITTIEGKRRHVVDERGEWCTVVNESGVYLQTLVLPSQDEIIKEQAHQEKIQAEQALELAKETRRQELKNKMQSGENLSSEELIELLRLAL